MWTNGVVVARHRLCVAMRSEKCKKVKSRKNSQWDRECPSGSEVVIEISSKQLCFHLCIELLDPFRRMGFLWCIWWDKLQKASIGSLFSRISWAKLTLSTNEEWENKVSFHSVRLFHFVSIPLFHFQLARSLVLWLCSLKNQLSTFSASQLCFSLHLTSFIPSFNPARDLHSLANKRRKENGQKVS